MKKNNLVKKIAFIKMGKFSHTNSSILNILESKFPDNPVIVIDVWQDVAKRKLIKNLFYALYEYGPKILLSKRSLDTGLMKNSYIFKNVKKKINKFLNDDNYLFTFQTQSILDTSVKGIPNYVYTDHTFLENEKYPGFNKNEILYNDKWIECEKTIYNNATINFTMSNNISNSIIEQYGCEASKVVCAHVAPNIDISKITKVKEDKYIHPHILFVGVQWERKGGPTLVKAFSNILKKYPEAKLTIVGCSPDVNIPNCNVVGRVPIAAVGDYFNDASIFCLPTTKEPFGIVFLEAMAYKLPVIGTNIGGIPEFIHEDKNGFVIEVGDVESLTEKLLELIESPKKCESFGSYGHKLLLKEYTWDTVGKIMKDNIVNSLK